jgi:hypothetical protein
MRSYLAVLVLLQTAQLFAGAIEISVGSTPITILPPDGYVQVTDDVQPYADFAKRFVAPSNVQFALFISEADMAIAVKGEMPQTRRWFYVQAAKKIIPRFTSSAEFVNLKNTIKGQNDEIIQKAQRTAPEYFDKLNKGLSDDYKLDIDLALQKVLPLPVHFESDRALAYATLLKYNVNDDKGQPSGFEGVVTATFAHIKGKVLFFYANADKDGLAWSKDASRKWVDAVIAANPSTDDIAAREANRFALPWNSLLPKIAAGGVLAAIVGVIILIARRRKSAV